MRTIAKVFILVSFAFLLTTGMGCQHDAAKTGQTITEQEVMGLFSRWNDALQTGDPQMVSALYAPAAILLPTVSNIVRHNHEEIADYFVHFLALKPAGVINESNIRIIGDIAINSGIYTFSVIKDEIPLEVQARFTYVYQNTGGEWLIIEHHSSAMPEY